MCYHSGQCILAVGFFIFSADSQKQTENPQDPCHILAFFLARGLQLYFMYRRNGGNILISLSIF